MRRWVCFLALGLASGAVRAADAPPVPDVQPPSYGTLTPDAPRAAEAAPEQPAPHGRVITLEEAYDITLATDQSIEIAYQQIKQANLLTWSALTRLGPNLSAGAGYDRNQTRAFFTRDTTESSSLNISYSQTFLDFSVFPAYRYGKLAGVASRLDYQYLIRQTLYGLANAYYTVLNQEGVVTVDKEAVDLAAQQLDVAQKRFDVGEVTPTDQLNAKVTYESARHALIGAQNTLLADRDTLGNILNLGGDSGFQLVKPEDYPTTLPSFEKLLAIGYRSREDLKVAQILVDEDVAKKGIVASEYLPKVVGQASDSYGNAHGFYGPQTQVWDTSISVSMPFLTGGQREIDLRTAGEQVVEDQLARDKAMKVVESDVRTDWLAARSLLDSMDSLKLQLDAARKSYDDLRAEYQAGTASSVDVLSGLNSLINSENELRTQVYQLQLSLRQVELAAGVFQEQRVQRAKFK